MPRLLTVPLPPACSIALTHLPSEGVWEALLGFGPPSQNLPQARVQEAPALGLHRAPRTGAREPSGGLLSLPEVTGPLGSAGRHMGSFEDLAAVWPFCPQRSPGGLTRGRADESAASEPRPPPASPVRSAGRLRVHRLP